jgi:hypothetical protein
MDGMGRHEIMKYLETYSSALKMKFGSYHVLLFYNASIFKNIFHQDFFLGAKGNIIMYFCTS